MEEKRYEVELVYRQTVRYVVQAPNRKVAERIALERWQQGEQGTTLGHELCEVESVQVEKARDEEGSVRDQQKVLRFLRDRELVIERLDLDAFNPSVHDAISADDVAVRLGWTRSGSEGVRLPDVPRATRALEALCQAHRVVCFTRPRVRRGERGEIRLYCTPQHLEKLASLLEEPEAEAV